MAFAVILYLDPTTEAEVEALWALLAEKEISTVSFPAAVDVCRRSNHFHAARLVEIALVEYLPVREVCVCPFGGT